MTRPLTGGLFILGLIGLGGCFAPVSQREAQDIATVRLNKYCRSYCGTVKIAGAQKIKDRWLVDFDSPRHIFTVTVENDGNSKVTTWDK